MMITWLSYHVYIMLDGDHCSRSVWNKKKMLVKSHNASRTVITSLMSKWNLNNVLSAIWEGFRFRTWFGSCGGFPPLWDRHLILPRCFRVCRCGVRNLLWDMCDSHTRCHLLLDVCACMALYFWWTHVTGFPRTCFFTNKVHWLSCEAQNTYSKSAKWQVTTYGLTAVSSYFTYAQNINVNTHAKISVV